ncbi:DUF1674 domain-containing protein [Phyllobacterium sp. 21LDTY02-6]|uniref:DUF1674 domain-containing protein n=1 Tax=unclassified Phyllobacterium TaxID=2638441 RepID=UPI002021192E|nr:MULTISPECIES: DUF1674 domain-containing protein [unclassified Phyllobacterium]MCO4317459.1 DUF1674 domain-containing protein [Phyllobacterium sp. 21LDTY02-6]MCX8293162.1 DUF1674 domain-containing protein [Phyllobacterium sp. 0TCS1.6A]
MSATKPDDARTGEAGAGEAEKGRSFDRLPPAAQRALREAEARRARGEGEEPARPREIGGRGGKDPARFGDWEIKGRTIDF